MLETPRPQGYRSALSSQGFIAPFLPLPFIHNPVASNFTHPSQLPCILLCISGKRLQMMVKGTEANKGCGPLQDVHYTTAGLLCCLALALKEAHPTGSRGNEHYIPGA